MVSEKNSSKSTGVRHRAHQSVDKMMDKAESIGEKGKEAMDRLKDKAITMKENVDDYIRENPTKSVLIAAGIGAVVGAMIAAAMMRKNR